MTLINYLINAYIDANILLICAFSIWSLARFILGRFGFSQAFGLQLKLLNLLSDYLNLLSLLYQMNQEFPLHQYRHHCRCLF